MGAMLSAVRAEVNQGAENGHEDIVSVLDTLQELADTKAKLFYANLVSQEKLKEYHINKVQNLTLKTYVSIDKQSLIAEELGNAVGTMIKGDWLKGIVELFSTTLNAVIGSGAGTQSEANQFYVFVSGLGINRLDFYIYTREVEFKQFSSKNTKIVVIGYALSSIDAKEMTRSDLNQIVSNKKFYDKDKNEITDELELLKKQSQYIEIIANENGIKIDIEDGNSNEIEVEE